MNRRLVPVFAFLLAFPFASGCDDEPGEPKHDATVPVDASPDASDAAVDAVAVDASDAAVDASDATVDATIDASPTECAPGAVDCYVKTPRTCSPEGRWVRGPRCADACFEGECVPCLPGYIRCDTDGTGGASLSRCTNDYVWVPEPPPCPSGQCTFWCDVPANCTVRALECGLASDGLGGVVDCDEEVGGCPPEFVCGTGAQANHCVPGSAGAVRECEPGTFDCASTPTRRCSVTGRWLPQWPDEGPCGTEPATCTSLGYECGESTDGFGHPLVCGPCDAGFVCGEGASAHHCVPECVPGAFDCFAAEPRTCSSEGHWQATSLDVAPCADIPAACLALGFDCGSTSDGMGGIRYCGDCPAGFVCGGAALPNRCSPMP